MNVEARLPTEPALPLVAPPPGSFLWLTCPCDKTIPSAVMITPES